MSWGLQVWIHYLLHESRRVALWIRVMSSKLLHDLRVIFACELRVTFPYYFLQVTIYCKSYELLFICELQVTSYYTSWYFLHTSYEIRANFCEFRDGLTQHNVVILVFIVIEEDIPSSATFTDKLSKIFLPSMCLAIYSIRFTAVLFQSSCSNMFYEGAVLKNCTKFIEKQLCGSLFFHRVYCQLIFARNFS